MIPRLVIGGVSSGVGKTTVVAALAAALRARGLRVAAFKCGPDYLDPTWHARATGRPCHNLDGWMMGRDAVLSTFVRGAEGADLALIEGVMGLFDGASPDSEDGSTAQIAKWLDAPVLAVVDARGMARTIAAIGSGLAAFDPALRIAGVFANSVGSKSHLDLLKTACRGRVPVIGGLRADKSLALPERHLGLHAARDAGADVRISAWAAQLGELCSLDALLELARTAPPLPATENEPPGHSLSRCRIAVARDDAFHFYYDDNLRRLEALGAELAFFSPLADTSLPHSIDGLYLGGGYPELHAAQLAANVALRAEIEQLPARGVQVYAECGGLMYLARAVRTLDGQEHEMVGLVPGIAVMQPKLQALGYVEVETVRRTLLGAAGLRFRGHQFRYSNLEGAQGGDLAYRVRRRRAGDVQAEGYGSLNLLATYVHAHWASNPLVAQGFVDSCARHKASA